MIWVNTANNRKDIQMKLIDVRYLKIVNFIQNTRKMFIKKVNMYIHRGN